MTIRKKLLIGYKMFFALLGISSMIIEIAVLIERHRFFPAHFFSFFTIESNILFTLTLILSAFAVASGKGNRFDFWRGATSVYILVVGLGFSMLLSSLPNVEFTAVPWDNVVLHYITPAVAVVDLILDRLSIPLSFKKGSLWLIFPAAYLAYSLIRGALIGWYPYPFLDPRTKGYAAILGTTTAMIILAVVLVWVITKFAVQLPEKRSLRTKKSN